MKFGSNAMQCCAMHSKFQSSELNDLMVIGAEDMYAYTRTAQKPIIPVQSLSLFFIFFFSAVQQAHIESSENKRILFQSIIF